MTDHVFKTPMLLMEIDGYRQEIMSQEHVFVQAKLNGWRGMANTVTRKLYSRSGNEITNLPHIVAALPTTGPEWLDGELYKHGRTVDEIQSMIKQGSPEVEFHVFDCVSDLPFGVRIGKRTGLCWSPIKMVKTYRIDTCAISGMYDLFLKYGYEGAVIRLDGHPYKHGRSCKIFKMKPGTEVI